MLTLWPKLDTKDLYEGFDVVTEHIILFCSPYGYKNTIRLTSKFFKVWNYLNEREDLEHKNRGLNDFCYFDAGFDTITQHMIPF